MGEGTILVSIIDQVTEPETGRARQDSKKTTTSFIGYSTKYGKSYKTLGILFPGLITCLRRDALLQVRNPPQVRVAICPRHELQDVKTMWA